jgi:hypothetical protein
MKNASYAPVYAAMYPELAEIVRLHGYALAIHGSLQRDFDVIAIPWVLYPDAPENVISAIAKKFAINVIGEPKQMLHNRICYSVSVGWGECFLDISFMPIVTPSNIACSRRVPRRGAKVVKSKSKVMVGRTRG